jgi:uncharacterized repeat protein (TIGR02543 family)
LKTLKSLIFCLIVILGVSSFANAVPLSLDPSILYVMEGGKGDCFSWATACDLQTALSTAILGDQVWVAMGTYKPTDTADRSVSFQLQSGVAIYGGFPPAGGTLEQRDWEANLTTLSGDIGTIGDNTDNSYHVVTGNGANGTAILDGFTISGGNANGYYPHNCGGGMVNTNSSPTLTNVTFFGNSATDGGGIFNTSSSPMLTNVTFTGNSATYNGGGMYNYSSNPTLTNVTFSANSASWGGGMNNYSSSPTLNGVTFSTNPATIGGGMYNFYSDPTLTNVTFSVNPATNSGGGMYNLYSNPTLKNVTFTGNSATLSGGGMYNYSSNPTLTNAIVWGNEPALQIKNYDSIPIITYSDIQGYSGGTSNIDADPLLDSLAGNGGFTQTHALRDKSLAIDAGDPSGLNCPATDQRGYIRPIDGENDKTAVCDMGAYEYDSYPAVFPLTVNIVGSGSVTKNPDTPEYLFAEVVTLTATTKPGWTFTGWSGGATGTNNPLTVTITGNTSITANFTLDEYSLAIIVEPTGSGTVNVAPVKATYHYGDEVTLTPTANHGWTFASWSGNTTVTENKLTITKNTNITANFTKKLYLPLVMRN